LLLPQILLLFCVRLLCLAEILLRLPELLRAIDGGLVANDVGLFVALEPDEITGDFAA
jgi:hypothetical protein